MKLSTRAGSMFGLLTAVTLAGAGSYPAPAAKAGPALYLATPCCGITAIDAAKQLVTVKANEGWVAFEVKVANAAQLRGIRRGQAAGLSKATMTLFVYPVGGAVQAIKVTNISAMSLVGASTTGAVANAASGVPQGDFRREPGKKGGCKQLKESATEQCILTHDGTAEGKGCEYYCVPINR